MTEFDRKEHWDNVYKDKSPLEVSWYQKEPELSLALIKNTAVAKDQAVIDVGGGASVLVDRLVEAGFSHLSVLDLSDKALGVVRERLADKADMVEWYATDITEFLPPHPYAVWHDRAVFHFLTDGDGRAKYVAVLKKAMQPGSHVIIAAFAIGGPQKCSGLEIVQYDRAKLEGELGSGFKLVEEQSESHETPSGGLQKFSYFHFTRI